MLARVSVIAVALVACAWFVLGIRQTSDLNAASAIASSATSLTPTQAREAQSLLDTAGTLNPDRTVDIVRAQLRIHQGDLTAAQRILGRVTSAEPRNLLGWFWLAKASSHRLSLFLLVELKIRELEPPIPHASG